MRLVACFKGLLGAGLIVGALAGSGCGPDYAIYKVNVTSLTASNRNTIAQCRMTIRDEGGKLVLDHYILNSVRDPNNETRLKQGCEGGLTPQNIGSFSYSSSRSSGSLKFTVEAYDDKYYEPSDSSLNRVQWAESGDIPVKAYPPEIEVNVAIK